MTETERPSACLLGAVEEKSKVEHHGAIGRGRFPRREVLQVARETVDEEALLPGGIHSLSEEGNCYFGGNNLPFPAVATVDSALVKVDHSLMNLECAVVHCRPCYESDPWGGNCIRARLLLCSTGTAVVPRVCFACEHTNVLVTRIFGTYVLYRAEIVPLGQKIKTAVLVFT